MVEIISISSQHGLIEQSYRKAAPLMNFNFHLCEGFFWGDFCESRSDSPCLLCRGWRPAGAADPGHLHEPPDDVTREAAHVPFPAVPDCRQEPPVVCAPPPVPAAQPQRALHGWKPPGIPAPGWVPTWGGHTQQSKQLPTPRNGKQSNEGVSLVVPTDSVYGAVTGLILLENMLIKKMQVKVSWGFFKAIRRLSNLLYF